MQATDTDSYILESAYQNSYKFFYNQEINYRRLASYPPFVDIIVLELDSKYKETLMEDAKKLYKIFSDNNQNIIQVYSPKTPYIGKINNKYRVQIVLKAKMDNKVLDLIYQNLEIYDKIKVKGVNLAIMKNPVRIG